MIIIKELFEKGKLNFKNKKMLTKKNQKIRNFNKEVLKNNS